MQATQATRTPNQRAARHRIISVAADLIAEQGLSACTIRSVAERSGLTKSTVHYYFDDANELVDLSVKEIFERMARFAHASVVAAPDGVAALQFLVRLFMGRVKTPPEVTFRESMLWPAYTAHAWERGAGASILENLDALRDVFEVALRRGGVTDADVVTRADSVHSYLLGAMVRNMIDPLSPPEVARAVSLLSGLSLDPRRC